MDYSLPGSSVHGISQARILSGLPFPTPGDCPNPGNKPASPAGQADSFTTEWPGKHTWFKIGKEVHQGCILSPFLFNLHAEYITWNAGLDEAQARIKITRRNINNLRYADDTTFMAESEEELKSLLMKVKVAQLCPTVCDPVDYTVHGILQVRILEWVAFPFSGRSSQPRDWTQVSCIAGGFFTSGL